MAIVKSTGTQTGLSRFQDQMNDLFERFFQDWNEPFVGAWTPALDVIDHDDEIEVRAEMPGLKPEDIDIQVQGRTLMLSGEKTQSEEQKDQNYYRTERRYGSFRRNVMLPSDVDVENVQARCQDGVLTVTLPKGEHEKPRRIDVKS